MTEPTSHSPPLDEVRELLLAANKVRRRAYAPYSQFPVGAALRTRDGNIYVGTNIENASYGVTLCAERTAMGSAIAAGKRDFDVLAVVSQGGVAPCGACRQALAEFAPNLKVIIAENGLQDRWEEYGLETLLPKQFNGKRVGDKPADR